MQHPVFARFCEKPSMSKRILYLMHVDWDWIQQRPHFIARHLARRHDLLIFHALSRSRTTLTRNPRQGLRLWPLVLVRPQPTRLYTLFRIMLQAFFRRVIANFRPDFVWLTFPTLLECLPPDLRVPIVYDCMDNALGFDAAPEILATRQYFEFQILARAHYIFCSSRRLQEIVRQRGASAAKCTLVRNAYEADFAFVPSIPPADSRPSAKIALGYIGTISGWLDIDALHYCIRHLEHLQVYLIGPLEGFDPSRWKHPRLHFWGPVPHHRLSDVAQNMDVFILPFQLNDLTQAVDPVKLYEYIYFHKPILSVYYRELEHFTDFVTFYHTPFELLQALQNLHYTNFRPSYTPDQRRQFLATNTWASRMEIVERILGGEG